MQLALKPLLDQAIATDELFAQEVKDKESRKEKAKSFAECCEYIYGEAYKYAKEHKDGNMGMAFASENDIIAMIKHYYDEDEIKIEKVGGGVTSKVGKVETPKAKTSAKTSATPTKAKKEVKPTPAPAKAKEPEKPLSKKDIKKGADCYDLFGEMFS